MLLQENISLKPFNSFGLDVQAENFYALTDMAEMPALIEQFPNAPFILGGGSNVLLTKNIQGLVIKNELKGIEKTGEDECHVFLKVGAGENWHGFVMHCIEQNYAGIENLALIPGSVGASPMQNIGAYGMEVKDSFHSLQAWHLKEQQLVEFDKVACSFGYRESVFKHTLKGQFLISAVTFKLKKQPDFNVSYGAIQQELDKMHIDQLSIRAIAQAVMNIRSSKLPDPKQIGNAGSFFKNPEIDTATFHALQMQYPAIVGYALENGNSKLAAGWLIEQCGWKGFRKGDAGCHAKQALVLVNYGHAKGSEIYALSEEILHSVKDKFGVTLEREVNVI